MNMALAATTVLVLILGSASAGTVDMAATCKAAATNDAGVNLELCMSRLGNSTASDAWGLAQVACDACISSSIVYRGDLVDLTLQLEVGNKELKPLVEPLSECGSHSAHTRDSFEEAKKEVKQNSYAAAIKQLDDGISWTEKCSAGITAVQG
ncbi:pectinesterase inhibitor 12-like [Lolium perenne]|uniref:pectinesterase inhibitor 12-like n=1 Tax=Lolium perenne TaxID=4522 RepID=UPI0021F613F7|nr:pectinesterase inhibitor 12-like [Lolium perenne]